MTRVQRQARLPARTQLSQTLRRLFPLADPLPGSRFASARLKSGVLSGFACLAAGLVGFAVSTIPSPASAQTRNQPSYQQPGYPQSAPQLTEREQYCQQLERQLAEDWLQSNQARQQVPDLQSEIRKTDRIFQSAQAKAERSNCYEYFFFSKTIKKTRACMDLDRQINAAKRRLADLEAQRQMAKGSGRSNSRQDDMIRELARYGCGPQYQQEAKRRQANNGFFNFWDRDNYRGAANSSQPQSDPSAMPFATYRTLCVRLCDGYYFPVSFSTLPSNFKQDEIECDNRCAAPTELFVHQNPGGSVEQMASTQGQPYSQLPNAFRFRQEFVNGCSCNAAEYVEDTGAAIGPVESSKLGPLDAAGSSGNDTGSRRRAPISQGTKQANLGPDGEAPPPLNPNQIAPDEGDSVSHESGGQARDSEPETIILLPVPVPQEAAPQ